MITTSDVKRGLFKGGFHVGDESSDEVVLMVGSCRGIPHLNWLSKWNDENGRPFLIYYIDPHDYHWDKEGNLTDMAAAMEAAAQDVRILSVLSRTRIFIHEHFQRFGMFNTDRSEDGNIYTFNFNPRIDICLPNFHDRFILFQNIIDFDQECRSHVDDSGSVSKEGFQMMRAKGVDAISRFVDMCEKTSFPDFGEYFLAAMNKRRLFWNHNHVTNSFSVPLFYSTCEKLGISPSLQFILDIMKHDMFDSLEKAHLSHYDVEAHGWDWGEPLCILKP